MQPYTVVKYRKHMGGPRSKNPTGIVTVPMWLAEKVGIKLGDLVIVSADEENRRIIITKLVPPK